MSYPDSDNHIYRLFAFELFNVKSSKTAGYKLYAEM